MSEQHEKKENKVIPIKQRKQQKNGNKRPNRRYRPKRSTTRVKVPYVLRTPVTPAPDNTYALPVLTTMDPPALKTMLFGLSSYLLQLGFGSPSPRSPDVDFQTLWSGMDYMLDGIWSEIRGGTITLANRPRLVHDFIYALKDKVVGVRAGKFSYAWNEDGGVAPISSTQYGPVTYYTVGPVGDAPMYNSSNFAVYNGIPDLVNYNKLVKYLSGKQNPALEIVSSDTKSPLAWDVCARSRAYAYCGLRPTASSGWALSVENELPLLRPSLAKFVAYNKEQEDKRIPTQLSMDSGDPCTMLGMHVLGLSGPLKLGYMNRCPPRFIPLDFESVYDTLCLWMVKLKRAASINSNDPSIATQPLPFSQQDFRIALAQSLKGLYETSWTTQFVGPLEYNQDGNAFIPFLCSGNCYGNPEFARRFMVPELISENLNALKARAVSTNKEKANTHSAIYIPILGRWYLDEPVVYTIPSGEGTQNLFSELKQDSINILDGSMGTTPIDLNNSYYKGVISDWNSHVEALKNVSASVGPMVRDRGPIGLPLILCSTLERVTPTETSEGPIRYRKQLIDKYVANMNAVKAVDIKTKKVTYVPAATTPQLDLQATYTLLPQTDVELLELMGTLITPSIRFNEGVGDVLNSQMWAVHTRFLNSFPNGAFGNIDTQSKYES